MTDTTCLRTPRRAAPLQGSRARSPTASWISPRKRLSHVDPFYLGIPRASFFPAVRIKIFRSNSLFLPALQSAACKFSQGVRSFALQTAVCHAFLDGCSAEQQSFRFRFTGVFWIVFVDSFTIGRKVRSPYHEYDAIHNRMHSQTFRCLQG